MSGMKALLENGYAFLMKERPFFIKAPEGVGGVNMNSVVSPKRKIVYLVNESRGKWNSKGAI